MTEDEMFRWHNRLSGHELEKTRERVKERETWHVQFMGWQRVRHDLATTTSTNLVKSHRLSDRIF